MAKSTTALLLIILLTWILPTQLMVRGRLKNAPPVMLWVWERPDDLRDFAGSKLIGLAFLAATINISAEQISIHRRRQSLSSNFQGYLMPVVRIESDRKNCPNLSEDAVDKVVAQIVAIAAKPGWHGLQIDFDATREQRPFYQMLLSRLRQALPAEMPLSMTAIASWCAGDYWLANLPVDEVVPMYFDMGVKESAKWQYVESISTDKNSFRRSHCKCHAALGLSTSEEIWLKPAQYAGKRIYFFSRHPWQMSSVKERAEITKVLKYTEAS